ncbi:uncharacterized protein BT62DRAFT_1011372 [Guyanagaster necrorhizus]|uniref:Uncharacterized protein n=1 Tax=Guyanagaster necrorhizus TaxID=856835 RepID=A0A9P7VJN9_9AGAR|nr:uncharacterized protein BT62DRAFT_1011372 [Guyanagaster necrorhizus MCA 3950]KAG7441570.1 hypothetical protein BT62DRAFT_1011372 [Guyanagaster necrorhizus MCA 3950]
MLMVRQIPFVRAPESLPSAPVRTVMDARGRPQQTSQSEFKRAQLETFQSLSSCRAFFSRPVHLDLYSDPPEDANFKTFDAFSSVARFMMLELKTQESDLYDIPYHKTTAFFTPDQRNDDHLRLLARMPNLEELSLNGTSRSSQAMTPATVISLQMLSSSNVVRRPSLKALSIILDPKMSPVFPDNFLHAETIMFLNLGFAFRAPEDTESLETFLRRLPKVTALKIMSRNIPASFFRQAPCISR